ncbi:hypothetical protein K502DRAFT_346097 [Neoconidiobolus thromboides FSU 785]|nr:hypothetical protein K502DRAFT_346097 [Neoconidiobolus thromboides FSU 785]
MITGLIVIKPINPLYISNHYHSAEIFSHSHKINDNGTEALERPYVKTVKGMSVTIAERIRLKSKEGEDKLFAIKDPQSWMKNPVMGESRLSDNLV